MDFGECRSVGGVILTTDRGKCVPRSVVARLDRHSGNGIAPVGITECAQGTNLKCIDRSGRQISNRHGLFHAGKRYGSPCSGDPCGNGCGTQVVGLGADKHGDQYQQGAGNTLIDLLDSSRRYFLRRGLDGGNRLETT